MGDGAPVAAEDTRPEPDSASTPDPCAEVEDRLRRALADYDNLRKRYEREAAQVRAAERERVAAAFLPVVDDLERALAHADGDGGEIARGLAVVLDEAHLVLARLGYPRYEDLGEVFDPQRHEALGAVDADAPAGTVVATVRPGYGEDGDILRPAGVMVARTRAG